MMTLQTALNVIPSMTLSAIWRSFQLL